MRTILGVLAATAGLCLMPWALPAQEIRPDSSALVVLSQNSTDMVFQLYVKRDSVFYPVVGGESAPHTNRLWVIPSSQLSPRDTLCVLMWILVGTHQMKADTISRAAGRVNIYRRDFHDRKPEAKRT